ncbi:translocon-associated protein subunit gamma-like [Dysidea avara]|uniref:translocon-associated protein subunit gamma-like n=1 Tax=Dysidea avara TaxID=196820 RepID=UPI00332D43AF
MPSKKGRLSDDDKLLQRTGRDVSTTASALFYGHAIIVSALPLWLCWRVYMLDMFTFSLLFLSMTLLSTWLLFQSYKRVMFSLKHKIAQRRENAVSKEIIKQLGDTTEGKKMSKTDKDQRVEWKVNEVADSEATTFAIFYNNTLFLFLFLLLSYLCRGFHPAVTYSVSMAGSGFILLFISST